MSQKANRSPLRRILGLGLLFLLLVAAVIVLGGDGVWSLGGSHRLDVSGSVRPSGAVVAEQTGWSHYGGDAGGMRYSSLTDITPETVDDLALAWRFSTGDLTSRPPAIMRRAAAEGTPLLLGDALIFCTPFNEVVALDPGTGVQKWRFDPEIDLGQQPANQFVCRGLAAWPAAGPASHIFMGTNDSRLIALDLATGQPAAAFGEGGTVTIDPGMDLWWPGEFQITSPPVIVGDTVVVGSSISDNARVEAPHGVVRAYDTRTGALKWTFDPIPRDEGAAEAQGWQGENPPAEGHANAWAPMAADLERGLVFLPTSSPSPDFFGGLRPGDNRYANSVVALEAETGAVRWAFQTVHHDVWDYDLPAQPGLYTITVDGQSRDVVAQVAKTGFVFVLDRDTGEPVLPVEERPVPQSAAPGEVLSPTQPMPVAPPPLVDTAVKPKDAWGITLIDKLACRRKIEASDNEGLFTPPSVRGTLMKPFSGGGANWGGAAFDPAHNLLVVNMNNAVHHIQLIPTEGYEEARALHHDQEVSPQAGAPFAMKRELLFSPLSLPCTAPPWGILAGVDIAEGRIVWRRTFGTTEDLTGGMLNLAVGTPNFGGPIVTAGGLVFIGAAMDDYLRAIDVRTGDELWKGRLPAGGQATPMTYRWQGRQYVVIYAGGHGRAGTTLGDEVVAFALPE